MKFIQKTDSKKLEKINFNREFKEHHLHFDYLTLKVNYFLVVSASGLTSKSVTHISFHNSIIRPYNISVFHNFYFSYI